MIDVLGDAETIVRVCLSHFRQWSRHRLAGCYCTGTAWKPIPFAMYVHLDHIDVFHQVSPFLSSPEKRNEKQQVPPFPPWEKGPALAGKKPKTKKKGCPHTLSQDLNQPVAESCSGLAGTIGKDYSGIVLFAKIEHTESVSPSQVGRKAPARGFCRYGATSSGSDSSALGFDLDDL